MKKHIDNDDFFDNNDFGLCDDAVSHTETTGLIPFSSSDEDGYEYEIKSYMEIDEYLQRPIT